MILAYSITLLLQFYDLQQLFKRGNQIPEASYVFMVCDV